MKPYLSSSSGSKVRSPKPSKRCRKIACASVGGELVFARDGDSRLVLVTCGGRFDPARRSYDDNIVVRAVPA